MIFVVVKEDKGRKIQTQRFNIDLMGCKGNALT